MKNTGTSKNLLNHTIRTLHYYRLPIFRITAGLMVLTLAISILWLGVAPGYVATSTVTTLPSKLEIGFTSGRGDLSRMNPAMVLSQTHTEFLLSRTIAEDTARALTKEVDPRKAKWTPGAVVDRFVIQPVLNAAYSVYAVLNYGYWKKPEPFEQLVNELQKHTEVENVPGSYILAISVAWDDPDIAAHAANMLTERYVDLTLKANQEEMRLTRQYIDAQIAETSKALQGVDERIQAFKEKEKLYDVSTDINLRLEQLAAYVKDHNDTQIQLDEVESRVASLKAYQSPAAMVQVEADRAGLHAKRTALETVIKELTTRLDAFPGQEVALLELYREKSDRQKTLAALQDRLLDTRIAEAAQLSAVKIIDPAVPPAYPEMPMVLVNTIAAMFVGLVLSCGYVMGREYHKNYLRTRLDLDPTRGDVAGVVPFYPTWMEAPNGSGPGVPAPVVRLGRAMLGGDPWIARQKSSFHRHIEHLLARLLASSRGQIVAFAGMSGGEGCSYIVEKLARMAAQVGKRVLLVDADVGHPAICELFDKPAKAGVSDVLAAKHTLRDAVISVDKHIDIIGAGLSALDVKSRANVPKLGEQLRELAAQYDLVLVDAPALRADPMAESLWNLADQVVCVFDASSSSTDDADDLARRIGHRDVPIRYVLNKVKYSGDFLFTN